MCTHRRDEIAFIIRWLALTHFTRRFLLFEILTYQILSIACHGEFILFAENVIKLIELRGESRLKVARIMESGRFVPTDARLIKTARAARD